MSKVNSFLLSLYLMKTVVVFFTKFGRCIGISGHGAYVGLTLSYLGHFKEIGSYSLQSS